MADNTRLPLGTEDGDVYASDDISSVKYQRVKVVLGANGTNDGDVASGNPLPVSGTFWQATQPVSGTFWQATQPVSGPLTDTELRATPVAVSGTVTATTGGLTDTQLRASAVPVSGTVATNEIPNATVTYAPTNATTTAYAASLVVKASAGVLFSITGFNNKNAAQFVQLHNASSLPADTAVPVIMFTVPKASNFSLDFGGKFGRYFSTGIVICNSTTGPTKTIGAADCWFDCQYA